MGLSALLLVGGYALVKGQVSEKLALRHGAAIGSQQIMIRAVPQLLPRGLDDKRLDFSPKEDTDRTPIRNPLKALQWMASEWWDELCWGFAVMTLWGLVRQRFILGLCRDREPETIRAGRSARVLGVFAAVFLLVLLRHTAALGYLSGRHMIPLVAISVPWAAAGTFVCLRGLGVKLPWSPRVAWAAGGGRHEPGRRDPGPLSASAQPPHAVGTLGGGAVAGRACPAVRRGPRHPRLGPVHLGSRRLRLLARPPGAHGLAPLVRGRGPRGAGREHAQGQDAQCSAGLRGDPGRGLSLVRGRARRRREDLPVPSARLLGGTGPMSYGSLWERLVRGVRWSWVDPRYQGSLPPNLDTAVMAIDSRDRLHAKQGRSTARVVFHPAAERTGSAGGNRAGRFAGRAPGRGLSQAALPAPLAHRAGGALRSGRPALAGRSRMGAPGAGTGPGSPCSGSGGDRRTHRALGVPAKLSHGGRADGCQELNVALPELARALDPASFATLKRRLVAEMARITATLHGARIFHKDLYLCHFYLDRGRLREDPGDVRLALIDLHRLGEHRLWPDRWRWKDLGQLLYSTEGVAGIDRRDIQRFWFHYRRRVALRWPRWQARMVRLKARRYLEHNRRRP